MSDQVTAARSVGGKKAAGTFLWVFLLFECVTLFLDINTGYTKGFRYFIKSQTDIGSLGMFLVLFVTVFLFGRAAGTQILVKGKDSVLIGWAYAFFTFAIVFGYVEGFVYVKRLHVVSWWPLVIVLFIIILVTWLGAVWRIKRVGVGAGADV